MCGICGFTWEDKDLLKKMMKAISHRGPDDSGSFCYRDVSLGHMRLSIIDLSVKGRQPMSNEDGSIWITFNGEIYNYKSLRVVLESKGHRFMSNTDTEVIIHGYEEYGLGIVEKLNGFFSFAIYDTTKKRFFAARDRLGIKPFYFSVLEDKELVFASEIKSILELGIRKEVDVDALHDFLSFRCVSIDQTMFKGIKKLLPGHYLIRENKEIKIVKYWDVTLSNHSEEHDEDYYSNGLYDRLTESIKMRMMSDVPIGAYLSGGIDSGSVVGIMSKISNDPVKTFSVGFGLEEHQDELDNARIIADHFGTDHHEIIVDPDTVNVLPKVVWHLDEPMSDPTSIPTYLLSKEAKKKCTVILTGEGADEQLAGYSQYKMMLLHRKLSFIPGIIRRFGAETSRFVPKNILNSFFKYAGQLGEKGIDRFIDFSGTNDDSLKYLNLVSIFNEKEKLEVFTKQNVRRTSHIDINSRLNKYFSGDWEYLDKLLKLETKTLLAENLLMKVDKNTMAFGIEARVPFLDHNVVDFSFNIPPRYKLMGKTEKYVLRKAMKDLLPEQTIARKKERFFVPINRWFTGELKEVAKQILSDKNIERQGFFSPKYIERAFRGYKRSSLFYSRQLWSLMSFSLWHSIYIDGEGKKPKGLML